MKITLPVWAVIFLVVLPCTAQVRFVKAPEKIDVEIEGKPFTTFHVAGANVTKPYLWPVRAASGTYITRAWPLETVAEEGKATKDHLHQRGVWFAHESVNGIDFWNNDPSYKEPPRRGKIVLKKIGDVTGGKKNGTLSADFDWTDRQGNVIVTEHRVMTFYGDKTLRMVDFDILLTSNGKVVWSDNKDGAFAIRLRPILDEDGGTGKIVNADGLSGEKQVWGKPSNWCDYSGAVGDEKLGVAIFDYPENPGHPVRWHVRGYGLFAANPFGLAVFTGDKSQSGARTVEAGQSLRYRYRMIVHPGDAQSLDLSAMYAEYAAGR